MATIMDGSHIADVEGICRNRSCISLRAMNDEAQGVPEANPEAEVQRQRDLHPIGAGGC
jgi:hypothetical protein